jgi:hypothetical protein
MLEESKLLADAVNLGDFGLTGLIELAIETGKHGQGHLQLLDDMEKREQYGYWDLRLKDGFHFEPIRKLARKRLESARSIAALLKVEMEDDKL